jgi:hypothetical protein
MIKNAMKKRKLTIRFIVNKSPSPVTHAITLRLLSSIAGDSCYHASTTLSSDELRVIAACMIKNAM